MTHEVILGSILCSTAKKILIYSLEWGALKLALVSCCANQDMSGGLLSRQRLSDRTTWPPTERSEVRVQGVVGALCQRLFSRVEVDFSLCSASCLITGAGGWREEFPLPLGESHSKPICCHGDAESLQQLISQWFITESLCALKSGELHTRTVMDCAWHGARGQRSHQGGVGGSDRSYEEKLSCHTFRF